MPGIQIVGRSGEIADVTGIGALNVSAVTLGYAHRANLVNEEAYTVSFSTTPVEPNTGDFTTIFYMKNEKQEELIIEQAIIHSHTEEEV